MYYLPVFIGISMKQKKKLFSYISNLGVTIDMFLAEMKQQIEDHFHDHLQDSWAKRNITANSV
jgi:hypothetical protein